ncbi:MAG: hypothetical protein ACRCZ2_08775 [Fusobacteriaceae bacterium]
MNVDQSEMVLNMETFDFNDINDGFDDPSIEDMVIRNYNDKVNKSATGPFDVEDIDDPDNDFGFNDEEFDTSVENDEDDVEDTSYITEALSQLGAIDDAFELDFGGQKVSKGDLVKLLDDRETLSKTREAVDSFTSRLIEKEEAITVSFEVAKTETEKQLEHVYSMLNDPDKWNDNVDVQKLQRARIQLEARKNELDKRGEEATRAIAEQKQQAVIFNIQKVVQEMGSQAPLNEAAQYAQNKGINLDSLVQNLTPSLVQALQNAAKYEALVEKNKTKIAAAASARKPRSVSEKGAKTSNKVTSSERTRAQKLYKQGKLTDADMFKFLED